MVRAFAALPEDLSLIHIHIIGSQPLATPVPGDPLSTSDVCWDGGRNTDVSDGERGWGRSLHHLLEMRESRGGHSRRSATGVSQVSRRFDSEESFYFKR